MIKFLKNVISEMRKVSWPTRGELFRKTLIVIVSVVFLMLFSYLVDLGITTVIRYIK